VSAGDGTEHLPIELGPVSNGEYDPVPVSPVLRETARRTRELLDRQARRLGMSRREFLRTSMATARLPCSPMHRRAAPMTLPRSPRRTPARADPSARTHESRGRRDRDRRTAHLEHAVDAVDSRPANGVIDRRAGGAHDCVRPHPFGEMQPVVVAVDGDDARGALHSRDGDRSAADRAASEHHDGAPGEITVRACVHSIAQGFHGGCDVGGDGHKSPGSRAVRGHTYLHCATDTKQHKLFAPFSKARIMSS